MAVGDHIANPFEYLIKNLTGAFERHSRDPAERARARIQPRVRKLTTADLRAALKEGAGDFAAARDDVVFIVLFYPVAGLLLAAAAARYDFLPMIFPLASGFAILGPLAAVGLYEISRRREAGEPAGWMDAAGVLRSPALGSIVELGLVLVGLFLAWLTVAYAISLAAFGSGPPPTADAFVRHLFSTGEGWRMIVVGVGVGFLFAAAAFAISVVSFPLMLDRHADPDVAVRTSLKAVAENPGVMALWAAIVAGLLVLGSLPALLGLVFVVPILGHATWRLYRRAVEPG